MTQATTSYLNAAPVSLEAFDAKRSQRIAEAAGFTFTTPSVPGYVPAVPSAPAFARFGDFALLLRCCIDEASRHDIHRGTVSGQYADPIAARVMLLAEALAEPDKRHIGLALNLQRFASDVVHAARQHPDRELRLAFSAAVYRDIANQFETLRLPAWAQGYRYLAESYDHVKRNLQMAAE